MGYLPEFGKETVYFVLLAGVEGLNLTHVSGGGEKKPRIRGTGKSESDNEARKQIGRGGETGFRGSSEHPFSRKEKRRRERSYEGK